MNQVERRPQFLLDLAEELNWLNEHAGPDAAEHGTKPSSNRFDFWSKRHWSGGCEPT